MSSRIIWSNFRNYLTISSRSRQPKGKFNTVQHNNLNSTQFSSFSTQNNIGTFYLNNSEIHKETLKSQFTKPFTKQFNNLNNLNKQLNNLNNLDKNFDKSEIGKFGEITEGEGVRRLDNEDYFFLKNLRRLRPFLKFLFFQSIPILLLMFLYKYFEQKKLTSTAPITTESELIKHIISAIRNASSVLISNNNFTFVNSIKLGNLSQDPIQSVLSDELKLDVLELLIQDFNEDLTDNKVQLLTINRDKYTYILFEGTIKRREDKRFNFSVEKVNIRFISSNNNYTFVKNDTGNWTPNPLTNSDTVQ